MTTVQIATRIDAEEKKIFEETARAIGLTPADALRVFIKAFDKEGGFPFTFKRTSENTDLTQKKADFNEKLNELHRSGKLKRLNVNKRGAIVVPKDDSLNKEWIRDAWVR
jgi:DNA-damage-inducible protein J